MVAACTAAGPATALQEDDLNSLERLLQDLYQERASSSLPGNSFCIMESGNFYVQALIPHQPKLIFLEAVSPKFIKDWDKVVTKQKKALLIDLGFNEPAGNSPNYWMEIGESWTRPPNHAARVAVSTMKNIFGIQDSSQLAMTIHVPKRAHALS